MDETSSPAPESRSGDVITVTEKSLRLEALEQMGEVGQAASLGTQFKEFSLKDRSSSNRRFQFEPEEESEGEMDSDLWRELPEHLIGSILAKLPVLNFLRLRSVCKKWNSLISDPLFLENCSQAPRRGGASAPPLFLLYADRARQSYPTYDPALNAWYLLPQTVSTSPPDEPSSSSFVVLAAAGGLLCLTDTLAGSEEELSLCVSNPITKARRQLPPMIPMRDPYVVGMVVDREKNSYQILVARNGEHVRLQVYDSVSNSWEMTGSVLKRLALLVGTAEMEGVLYCLAFGTEISVLGYNVEKGVWEDLRAPMPAYLMWPTLFVSRGCLMLVGAIALGGPMKSVCVWQLDSLEMEWVEVLRMPEDLRVETSRGDVGDVGYLFVADGDYICFFRYRVKQMLMCNVFKKSWWWLPLCPFDTGVETQNLSGFPLQPSLVASV